MMNNSTKFSFPSILIIVTGIVGSIKYFFFPIPIEVTTVLVALFNLCFFVAIGFLLNKKYVWAKYLVLVITVFGLINFPALRQHTSLPVTIISLTFIIQRIILLIATILLFKTNSTKNPKSQNQPGENTGLM